MDTIALLSHRSPAAIVAYRSGRPITARQFLDDAALVAQRLPNARHVLNVCADRYQFTVGLAACLMSKRIQPVCPRRTPYAGDRAARHLSLRTRSVSPTTTGIATSNCRRSFSGSYGRAANDRWRGAIRCTAHPGDPARRHRVHVGFDQHPCPSRKTWVCWRVASSAERRAWAGLSDSRSHAMMGTVPGQHMYGFESTVLRWRC